MRANSNSKHTRSNSRKKNDQQPESQSMSVQRDLDFMGFETKVRGLIVELLEPFLEKSIKDRELIFKMEKEDEKFRKQINLLEMTVYKQDS